MLLFMLHFCVQIYHEINIEFYVHKFGLTVHTELTNSIVVQSTVNWVGSIHARHQSGM